MYDLFRSTFGLKFNYSVRLVKEKGANEECYQKLQLIKRCPKAWFKTAKQYSFEAGDANVLSSKLLNQSETMSNFQSMVHKSNLSAGAKIDNSSDVMQ